MSNLHSPVPLSPLRLLILGYGHVARAFLPLLASRSEWLTHEFGLRPIISGIGSPGTGFFLYKDGVLPESLIADTHFHSTGIQVENASALISTGKTLGASTLIELTTLNPQSGEPALTYNREALQAGMNVITANKGPVAYAQNELKAIAHQHNLQFRFESTVMDGFPIFNLTEFTLPAVGIKAFRALLNSTSTFVLHCIETGSTLDEAISQAQQLGIAEADPWHDLDGWDAVMKTTILANKLLNCNITPQMIERQGIRHLTSEDIRLAARSGSPLRLVSTAEPENNSYHITVKPEPIRSHDILHVGKGIIGVLSLETELMGKMTFIEHQATVIQTAYGIFSDLVTILRNQSQSL